MELLWGLLSIVFLTIVVFLVMAGLIVAFVVWYAKSRS